MKRIHRFFGAHFIPFVNTIRIIALNILNKQQNLLCYLKLQQTINKLYISYTTKTNINDKNKNNNKNKMIGRN